MMKPSAMLILVALLLLLGAGLLLVQTDRPDVETTTTAGSPVYKNFNPESITGIDLTKNDVAVKLVKKDGKWLMSSHKDRPVNGERVKNFLENVKSATLEKDRKGSDSLFNLDDKNRADVVFSSETAKNTLQIGKSSNMNKCFVRTDPKGPVLEIDRGVDTDAGLRSEGDGRVLDPAYFYDLKVLNIAADDVIDIAIKKGNDVVRVQKVLPGKNEPIQPKQELKPEDKPVWWITEPEGAPADEGAASSIASTLATLNVKSYADNVAEKDRGFDKPTAKVKIRLKDGSEHTFTFGKAEGDDVMLSVSGKADPFKVYKYVFDNVTKDLKKKDDTKEPGADPHSGLPNFGPPGGAPGGQPNFDPATMEMIKKKLEEAKKNKPQSEAPPIPRPPEKIEPETKPVLPPAVVKQPEPKIENSKPLEKKPDEKK
jgi:hypothetical protein